jgi:uncharacterized OB-fold protein
MSAVGYSQRVVTLYDQPMWDSMERRKLELQSCSACGRFRYPPGPACPHCRSMEYRWTPVSGDGAILSWVVFHRQYFEDYPPPYNAVAVQLAEGPIIVSTLVGEKPEGSWIGAKVELDYEPHRGQLQHVVRLHAGDGGAARTKA